MTEQDKELQELRIAYEKLKEENYRLKNELFEVRLDYLFLAAGEERSVKEERDISDFI